MGLNVVNILKAAEEKQKEISKSKKDLGIRTHLLLSILLRQWSWLTDSDSEGDEEKSNEEHKPPKYKDEAATKPYLAKKNGRSTKRKREKSENEPRPPKHCKQILNYGDNNEAVPSEVWTCATSSNPLVLKLKKAAKPEQEDQYPPAETYQPTEWDWLFDDRSRLPLDAPVPDPDLSFLDN